MIVDDDLAIIDALMHFLSVYLHHNVTTFSHPAEALESIKKEAPDILVCDLNLPDMDGITFIKKVRELPAIHTEIIIITGYGEKSNAIECLRLGAADFIEKPFSLETLRMSIDRVIEFINHKETIPGMHHGIPVSGAVSGHRKYEMIGRSTAILQIRSLIEKISKTNDTSVLITGETGTGKEIVAREIHFSSHRKIHPFYAKNCASVSEHLFESEFFGHVKGAFTDAGSGRKGWFEAARDSTLFLDEISELPMPMQPKFLRVLEEKNINRVGSSDSIPLNVRVIAASNTDLQELCSANKFRKDLYYRLNIFSIHIPPLRERREDIPLLFDFFIDQSIKKHGREPMVIEQGAYDLLLAHAFPGNVRELKNIAERLVIISENPLLTAKSIESIVALNTILDRPQAKPVRTIAEQEVDLIVDALKKSDNVIARAARILQITDQSLLRRIKKYGIIVPV